MGTRVYVGRLNYDVRERDIERFFKGYGRIREILIKNGFGFVDFDDHRDADDAVYELNGKELLGERVILEIARGPVRRTGRFGYRRRGGWVDKYGPPSRTEYRVIVKNLSSRISWQDLKDFMRQAGEVTYADAHKQNRNEGCVEFASYSDMKKAISKLDGMELNGRAIKLVEDKSRRNTRRSHTRSRSRSRSVSRTRSRSHSDSRSRRRSQSISKSRSRSRSKSLSHSKSRSKSLSPRNESKVSRSRSRSRSKSRDDNEMKSHSASPARSRSQSLEKSRSISPAERATSPTGDEDRLKED